MHSNFQKNTEFTWQHFEAVSISKSHLDLILSEKIEMGANPEAKESFANSKKEAEIGLAKLQQSTECPILFKSKSTTTFIPGYILHKGDIHVQSGEGKEESIKGIIIKGLRKEIWKSKSQEFREETIKNHNFIYLKFNQQDELVEIGVHTNTCDEFIKTGLTRILVGNILLPIEMPVKRMSDTTYQHLLDKFLPQLKAA